MTVAENRRTSADRMRTATGADDDLLALDTPVVSFHVHRPHMPRMPRMERMKDTAANRGQEMNRAMETARTFLPPPDRLLYYGGLGLLAAIGLLEWPVAAAIGAGTMVAARARGAMGRPSGPMAGQMEAPTPTTATRTPRTTTPSRARSTTTRTTTPSTRSTTRTSRTTAGGTTSATGRTTRARTSRAAGATTSRGAATTPESGTP
ncbi:hypothetical protein [Sphaerisporangium fuscum]|uniref:hypothetical protein n=1 Tax=Sphaerisporangium fuscum TaxID=2835868 RepID=UPI001BDD67EC|nr:hypothetical protein [Sphaerisporangium fuscum]